MLHIVALHEHATMRRYNNLSLSIFNKLMTHLPNKNPFKNQGLAIFVALMASFGERFGKKKSFKIKEMPQMAQIVR